jgi:hypothetical protein
MTHHHQRVPRQRTAAVVGQWPKQKVLILTKPDEIEAWLTAAWPDACKLQRKLSEDTLRIVATGKRRTRRSR